MAKIKSKAGPGQLQMFMSAESIMKNYQPLDADRRETYDEREGEPTGRKFTTEGHANPKLSTYDKEEGFAKHAMKTGDTHYRGYGHPESDAELWSRKLNETQMPLHEYKEEHAGGFAQDSGGRTPGWNQIMDRAGPSAPKVGTYRTGHTGTYEDQQQDEADYVQNKQDEHRMNREWDENDSLHGMLSRAMEPGGAGFTGLVHLGTQFGESGKPQVVGAHHRIAAMADIDPKRELPVLHSKDIWGARETTQQGWKYD